MTPSSTTSTRWFALLVAVLRTLRGPVFFPVRVLAAAYTDLFPSHTFGSASHAVAGSKNVSCTFVQPGVLMTVTHTIAANTSVEVRVARRLHGRHPAAAVTDSGSVVGVTGHTPSALERLLHLRPAGRVDDGDPHDRGEHERRGHRHQHRAALSTGALELDRRAFRRGRERRSVLMAVASTLVFAA
jgi:hypothetical protein